MGRTRPTRREGEGYQRGSNEEFRFGREKKGGETSEDDFMQEDGFREKKNS